MRGIGRLVDWARRLPPIAQDGALALVVTTYGLYELNWFGQPGNPSGRPFHLSHWSLLVFAMMSLPLALRRRNILLAYALIQTATMVGILAHVETNLFDLAGSIFMIVLIFAVSDRAPAWVAILAMCAQMGILLLAFEMLNPLPHQDHLGLYYAGIGLYFPSWALPFFVGWAQRRRRALTARLEARAEDLRLERERIAAQAAAAERIRIAQELRALVLRGVERMTGQARTIRQNLETASAAAPREISAIESMGRRTLVEMRRLLLVLRGTEAHSADLRTGDPPPAHSARTGAPDGYEGLRLLSGLPEWLRGTWLADLGLVLLFLAGIRAGWIALGGLPYKGLGLVLTVVIFGALLIRSRVPFAVMSAISAAVFVWTFAKGDSPNWSELTLFVAAYTVAARKGPRWAIAAVALVWFAWTPYVFSPRTVRPEFCSGSIGLCLLDVLDIGLVTLATFAVAGGVAMRVGRRINLELQGLTDVLVRTREERVRLAVVEERTRVARDLHDVVAHALTVMVVQAGAARALSPRKPERAREALTAVEHAGREAIAELDSLFGQLGLTGLGPAPTLIEPERYSVALLVDEAIEAGVRVVLLTDRDRGPLDAGLELAVYRIVQEALTNVRKHAPGARAWVGVRYRPDAVEVEVTDTGPITTGPRQSVPGAGLGLVGIAERAALFGGEADAGPTPEGGFRVRARLQRESVLV